MPSVFRDAASVELTAQLEPVLKQRRFDTGQAHDALRNLPPSDAKLALGRIDKVDDDVARVYRNIQANKQTKLTWLSPVFTTGRGPNAAGVLEPKRKLMSEAALKTALALNEMDSTRSVDAEAKRIYAQFLYLEGMSPDGSEAPGSVLIGRTARSAAPEDWWNNIENIYDLHAPGLDDNRDLEALKRAMSAAPGGPIDAELDNFMLRANAAVVDGPARSLWRTLANNNSDWADLGFVRANQDVLAQFALDYARVQTGRRSSTANVQSLARKYFSEMMFIVGDSGQTHRS